MRSVYLVAYDISDAKRLKAMHRCMLGFGDALQYSLFRCVLSAKEKLMMVEAAKEVINQREDSVMVVCMGPVEGKADERLEFLGLRMNISERRALIV
jgi:CRISPR-associated protein Cas2